MSKHPMIARAQVAQKCVDRFSERPYTIGTRDCVALAALALKSAGHRVAVLKGARYRSEVGAARLMRRLGYRSLLDAIDALGLERISPASALPGDILALPSGDRCPFGCALAVSLGNNAALAFFDGRAQAGRPSAFVTAWRNSPCLK